MLPGLIHHMHGYDAGTALGQAFDYAVIRYSWLPSNGTDMDTRTALIGLDPSVDGADVGWARNNSVGSTASPYLTWGKDNTGVGYESVLVDFNKIVQDFPTAPTITVRLRAFWYNLRGDGDLNIEFVTYQGGTMILSNYNFINVVNGIIQPPLTTVSYYANAITNVSSNVDGDDVGTLVYDVGTRSASIYHDPRLPLRAATIVASSFAYLAGFKTCSAVIEATSMAYTISFAVPDGAVAFADFEAGHFWTLAQGEVAASSFYVDSTYYYDLTPAVMTYVSGAHTAVVDIDTINGSANPMILWLHTTTSTENVYLYRYLNGSLYQANLYDTVNDLYSGELPIGFGRLAYTLSATQIGVSGMGSPVANAPLAVPYPLFDAGRLYGSPTNTAFRLKRLVIYPEKPLSDLPLLSAP